MSDLGTRSRKGMRDGISSVQRECGSRSWESGRRQTQLRNVGSVRQTYGGGTGVEGDMSCLGLGWRSGERTLSSVCALGLKLTVPARFISRASSHPSSCLYIVSSS